VSHPNYTIRKHNFTYWRPICGNVYFKNRRAIGAAYL